MSASLRIWKSGKSHASCQYLYELLKVPDYGMRDQMLRIDFYSNVAEVAEKHSSFKGS
jgi:hypothetical protein